MCNVAVQTRNAPPHPLRLARQDIETFREHLRNPRPITTSNPAAVIHTQHASVVPPTGLPAIRCRSIPLSHTRHTMRRNKNTRLDIELLVHRTPGEAIQEGLERPANQYVALDKTAKLYFNFQCYKKRG